MRRNVTISPDKFTTSSVANIRFPALVQTTIAHRAISATAPPGRYIPTTNAACR